MTTTPLRFRSESSAPVDVRPDRNHLPHPTDISAPPSPQPAEGLAEDPFSETALINAGRQLTGLSFLPHVGLAKGMLWHACLVTVDELFEDLTTHPDGVGGRPDRWESTLILSDLPPRFSDRFTGPFIRKFLTAVVEVTHCLTVGWTPLPTIAHALALRILLNKTGQLAEDFAIDLPVGWRRVMEDALCGDLDTDALYTPDEPRPENVGQSFASWFTPVKPGTPVPPFICP